MIRGSRPRNPKFGPLARDVLRDVRSPQAQGARRSPDPLLDEKHVDNPAIVTVFGAGIAGLTAAHELVTRGCLVQVVEKKRDAYARGRPQVGGMAATQYARVRANVADLHPELLASSETLAERKVKQWLLRLFAHNRLWWIQTETPPVPLHEALYSAPRDNAGEFAEKVHDRLWQVREAYRKRWIWDLSVRSALIGWVTHEDGSDALGVAVDHYNDWVARSNMTDLAMRIREVLEPAKDDRGKHPETGDIEAARELVARSLEHEFLCFRLIPVACEGVAGSEARARELLGEWRKFFKQKALDVPERSGLSLGLLDIDEDPNAAHVRLHRHTAWEHCPVDAWVQIEVVEQRLPGEHGFRFFPSYYRHIDDTMKRTPICPGPCGSHTAYDNFRPTIHQVIGLSEADRKAALGSGYPKLPPERRPNRTPHADLVVEVRRDRPTSIEGLRDRSERFLARLGCKPKDSAFFAARLLRFATSSPARRQQYEHISWKEFVGLDEVALPDTKGAPGLGLIELDYSPAMTKQIESAAQCVLAFSAAEADARTYGSATLQLFLDMASDGSRTDRTLNGPTSDAWLEPWREHLERLGVRFFVGELAGLREVDIDGQRELVPDFIRGTGEPSQDESQRSEQGPEYSQDGYELLTHESAPGKRPDFYVLAVELPVARHLTAASAGKDAPDFERLQRFHREAVEKNDALKDMTGVQFFFDANTSLGDGHAYYPYSAWGLSSISQSEFWSERGGFADGYLGVLSVDVSDTANKALVRGLRPSPAERQPQRAGARLTVAEALGGILGHGASDPSGALLVAGAIWDQLRNRVGKNDRLPWPRAFHIDQGIGAAGSQLQNSSKFLAAPKGTWEQRPGIRQGDSDGMREPEPERAKGKRGDILYALNHRRWVLSGTYMATHTRMTSMEAANESGRHAARAILERLQKDDAATGYGAKVSGKNFVIQTSANRTYNHASEYRIFDPPDIWPLEESEPEDLAIFRDLDAALFEKGLPHWMDICDFDQRLDLVVKAAELDRNAGLAHPETSKRLVEHALEGIRAALGAEPLWDKYRKASSAIEDVVKKYLGC